MNKSTITTLVLVAAVLILGVAYAALSGQTLTVNGTAKVKTSAENFDVEFVDATKVDTYKTEYGAEKTYTAASTTENTTTGVTGSAEIGADEDTMVLSVSNMTTKGDVAEFELPIINTSAKASEVDAILDITVNSLENGNEWFVTTASLDNEGPIAPGEVAVLTVGVQLKKTPYSQDHLDAINDEEGTLNKFTVTVKADPQ